VTAEMITKQKTKVLLSLPHAPDLAALYYNIFLLLKDALHEHQFLNDEKPKAKLRYVRGTQMSKNLRAT
jgi:hypothetical protein